MMFNVSCLSLRIVGNKFNYNLRDITHRLDFPNICNRTKSEIYYKKLFSSSKFRISKNANDDNYMQIHVNSDKRLEGNVCKISAYDNSPRLVHYFASRMNFHKIIVVYFIVPPRTQKLRNRRTKALYWEL